MKSVMSISVSLLTYLSPKAMPYPPPPPPPLPPPPPPWGQGSPMEDRQKTGFIYLVGGANGFYSGSSKYAMNRIMSVGKGGPLLSYLLTFIYLWTLAAYSI